MLSADNRSPSPPQRFSPRAGETVVVPNARGTPASVAMAQPLSARKPAANARASAARATPSSRFIDEEASVASSASNSDISEHVETDYEIINESDVEDITAEMNRVQLFQTKAPPKPSQIVSYSLEMRHPCILYTYKEDNQDRVAVEFLVPGVVEELVDVSLSRDKKQLFVKLPLPPDFTKVGRLQERMEKQGKVFDKDSHEASAFQAVNDKINQSNKFMDLFGEIQKVPLPFTVDENSLESYVFFHKFDELDKELKIKGGPRGYYCSLTVFIEADKKRKVATKSTGFKTVGI